MISVRILCPRCIPDVKWHVVALCALVLLAPVARASEDEKNKPHPPENVVLRTTDGVVLAATYWPSKLGKEAVPVILLHAAKGSRADFDDLAPKLQRAGSAVIAVDLRGHGADRTGELRLDDYPAMVTEDVEAVKKFLMAKNNAAELNIEKLCVVGVEMGASVAMNWAALDWSWPPLTTGKQGQDVKALVLVSPDLAFKPIRIIEAVADPHVRADLAVMIIVGKGNAKSFSDAKRIHGVLERYHPAPPEDESDRQTLYLRTPHTSLQGTRLLNEKSMQVDQMILKFIELRLAKQTLRWSDRKGPRE
jgi:pimeloyl-ACP methyl ester carboxylesterase